MKYPCYGCTTRTDTCHSTCERYKKCHEENEKKKAAIRAAKAPNIEYDISRKNSSFHKGAR